VGETVAYGRFADDELAVVAINAGDSATRVSFVAPELAGMHLEPVELPRADVVAIGQPAIDGSAWIELSGRSGAILLGRSNRS